MVVWEKCVDAHPLDALDTVLTVDIFSMPAFPAFPEAGACAPDARSPAARRRARGLRVVGPRHSLGAPIDASHPLPGLHDRAVILHTSGTNGVPKSAPGPPTRTSASTSISACSGCGNRIEGAETFFSLLPYHAFGLTFFLCAAVGQAATQVLLPKFDAQMALDAHKRRPVSFFVGVPPMFERILAREADRHRHPSIRYSVAGAMLLSKALAADWEATTGGLIVEGYGLSGRRRPSSPALPYPTGADTACSGVPFPPHSCAWSPGDDTRDVEDGQPGEIIVRGPQVFEGYS